MENAKTRILRRHLESAVTRSGTQRGMNDAKTSKPKPAMPKTSVTSKVIKKS